jgi:peptide/nickel transport system substrate-binding protein
MQAGGFNLPSQVTPFISGPVPPKGTNSAGIDNPDYTALVAKAETMLPPESCAYWNQAEQALFRDVDVAPVAVRYSSYFLSKSQAEVITYSQPIPTSIRVLK